MFSIWLNSEGCIWESSLSEAARSSARRFYRHLRENWEEQWWGWKIVGRTENMQTFSSAWEALPLYLPTGHLSHQPTFRFLPSEPLYVLFHLPVPFLIGLFHFFSFFLAMQNGLWDLSSLTRSWIRAHSSESSQS